MNAAQLEELESLKTTLRCLVLSSATVTDAHTLAHDYFKMEGERIPHVKFGYVSLLHFLRERCNDCLLISGNSKNPTITPIITKNIEHIDLMMSRQKAPSGKYKQKRASVMESQLLHSNKKFDPSKTFGTISNTRTYKKPEQICKSDTHSLTDGQRRASNASELSTWQADPKTAPDAAMVKSPSLKVMEQTHRPILETINNDTEKSTVAGQGAIRKHFDSSRVAVRPIVKTCDKIEPSPEREDSVQKQFANQSLQSRYNILYSNNTKSQLKELMEEHHQGGVLLENLNELYRDKFDDGIDFSRLGYCDLTSMLRDIPEVVRLESTETPGRLVVVSTSFEGVVHPKQSHRPYRQVMRDLDVSGDSDDALPGVPYDKGIFPDDCMGHRESIFPVATEDLEKHHMCEVNVSEVLDPSHFWFQLRSDDHDLALDRLMDEMLEYYSRGDGRRRMMEFGAVQIGQYCATNYEPDGWHRSIIVQIIDSDHVKVRHVDYGTVTRVARCDLRVLPSKWSTLPAQALRGCLANVRPTAGLSCWPYKTALRFFNLVNCIPLIAQIHSVDHTNRVIRLYLTDTTKEEDVYINNVLVTEGHADICDMHRDILEDFLLPSFEDFENGAAMNLAEKEACVAAGVFPEGLDSHMSLPVRIRSHIPAFPVHYNQEGAQSPESTSRDQIYDEQCMSSFYESHVSNCHYPESESTESTVGRSSVASSITSNLRSASQLSYAETGLSTETLTGYTNGIYESNVLMNRSQVQSQPEFASFKRKVARVKPNANEESSVAERLYSQQISHNRQNIERPPSSLNHQSTPPAQSLPYPYQTPNVNYQYHSNGSIPNPKYYTHRAQNYFPGGAPPLLRYPPGIWPPSMPPPNVQPYVAQGFFQPNASCTVDPHLQGLPEHQYTMGLHNPLPTPHYNQLLSSSVQSMPDANITLQIIQNTLGLSEIEMQMFLSTQRTNPEIAKKFIEEKIRTVRQNPV